MRPERRPTSRAELSRRRRLQGLQPTHGRRMSAWNEEMLLALAPTPWQPLSVREKQRDPLSSRWRLGLLAGVVLAHALALLGLLALLEKRGREQENAIVVDFIDEPAAQPVEVPNETITIHRPTASPKPNPTPKPATKPLPKRARVSD